ncbi:MAG: alpha-galactosidase [Bryobacterales bacterium]|nr:alpha-galactosidase [Bryobacterales bacterium]
MRRRTFLHLLPLTAAGAVRVRFDAEQQRWRLHNRWIELVLRLTPAGRFGVEELRNWRTGALWTPADSAHTSPLGLQADSSVYDPETLYRLIDHSEERAGGGGRRLSITLEDTAGFAHVTLDVEMYPNHPVLRYRTRFTNRQPRRVWIRGYDLTAWRLGDRAAMYRSFRVNQWVNYGRDGNFEPLDGSLGHGRPVLVRSGAHGQHCGWLAVRGHDAHGLLLGWEFDGRADISVRHDRALRYVHLSGPILGLNQPVEPGGTFEGPFSFLGLFQGDWDQAGWRTQRFAEAVLAKPVPDEDFPYITWDSWGYQTEIHEDLLRENAGIAASLGIELFVIDLGWARHIGDWHPDPDKFPSGLRALSDYVHSLGMKFGLHLPLAEASRHAPVLHQNPDWTSTNSYGYFDAESLCLSHLPVRDWIIGETVRLIDEYNVDWILQDGENMVKHCVKRTHTHDPANSNWANAVEGLNYVVEEVQRQRPATHWENCEDGGNMMTFNMVKNYVTSICCDDSGPLVSRQAAYGVMYPFPPRYSDRYMPDTDIDRYRTRSFMFGGPWIFMNKLPEVDAASYDWAKKEIGVYKRIRRHIRDGKVYHLTPRPAPFRTDALQSHDEERDTSITIVVRDAVAREPERLRLRGHDPGRTYRVWFEDDPREHVMSGAELLEQGVPVSLPANWGADIVYVEPAADSR